MLRKSRSVDWFDRQLFLSGLFLFISCGLLGCTDAVGESSELREPIVSECEEVFSENEEAPDLPMQAQIYVHVCGEVKVPGVYELPADSRIYDGIEAAGGMTEEAALAYLNQAEKLKDGQQIYVPSVQEMAGSTENMQERQKADDGRIDLNTAVKEDLMTLSGIGEVKAEAIIRYREENGGFTSIEELKNIEGIKDGVFNKVKDQIKVS